MAREHEISRIRFTEHALRHEVFMPGFFEAGPAYYDKTLFNGINAINPVDSTAPLVMTNQGPFIFEAGRSPKEYSQPEILSSITARKTHTEVRARIAEHALHRIPILSGNRDDIPNEGFHITDTRVTEPVLVADYEPNEEPSETTQASFLRLMDKTRPDEGDSSEIDERVIGKALVWQGPVVIGPTSVGEDAFEITDMENINAIIDFTDGSPEDFLRIFPDSNQHYEFFELTRPKSFEAGLRTGIAGYAMESAEKKERYRYRCIGGACVRAAFLGLQRHDAYISRKLNIPPLGLSSEAERVYRLPTLFNR
jgi:hypothetical protein